MGKIDIIKSEEHIISQDHVSIFVSVTVNEATEGLLVKVTDNISIQEDFVKPPISKIKLIYAFTIWAKVTCLHSGLFNHLFLTWTLEFSTHFISLTFIKALILPHNYLKYLLVFIYFLSIYSNVIYFSVIVNNVDE